MKKRELIFISILTILIVAMDLTGFPSSLFVKINISDIDPFYFTLMINFLFIGILTFLVIRNLCPEWKLGFTTKGLAQGLKRFGLISIIAALIELVAFYVGLQPFDKHPSVEKVLIEGVIYYIGVAIIEELYVRGLLLNLLEKLFSKNKYSTLIAVVLSSFIFGLGHIIGVLTQPFLIIVSKVIWTIGMGMFFGMVYKKTNNLWLPIIIHFIINVCALPYCFSSLKGYTDLTLYIVVPTYILLGVYSFIEIKRDINF